MLLKKIRHCLLQQIVHDRATEDKAVIQSVSRNRSYQNYLKASGFVTGKVVLDIGPGYGYGYKHLLAKNPKKIVCIEPFKEALDNFTVSDNRIEFNIANFLNNNFEDNCFDVVICIAVIYYNREINPFLAEIRRVLKNNGVLILSTFDKEVIRLLFGIELRHLSDRYSQLFTAEEFAAILKTYFNCDPKIFIQSPIWIQPWYYNYFSLMMLPLKLLFVTPRLIKKIQHLNGIYNYYIVFSNL